MHDGRAAAAPIAMKLSWTNAVLLPNLQGKHINLLELKSLISLLSESHMKGYVQSGDTLGWIMSTSVAPWSCKFETWKTLNNENEKRGNNATT